MNRLRVFLVVLLVVSLSGCAQWMADVGDGGDSEFPASPDPSDVFGDSEGSSPPEFYLATVVGPTENGTVVFQDGGDGEAIEVMLRDTTLVGYGPQGDVRPEAETVCVERVAEDVEEVLSPSDPPREFIVLREEADGGSWGVGEAGIVQEEGTMSLRELLIMEGLAVYSPGSGVVSEESDLYLLQQEAESEGRGIWGC